MLELGFVFASVNVAATHDPNDFFVTETLLPGITVWNDVHGTSPSNMFAVGTSPGPTSQIARRTGSGWALETTPNIGTLASVWTVSTTLAYATVGGPTVLKWDGTAWATLTMPGGFGANSVVALSPTEVYFGGNLGGLLGTASIVKFDGSSFGAVVGCGPSTTGHQIREMHVASGVILGFTIDSRGNAASAGSDSLRLAIGLAPTCAATGLVSSALMDGWGATSTASDQHYVGAGGQIFTGSGTTRSSPTVQDLWAVWGTSTSNIWAVGAAGTIIRFDGAVWASEPSTTNVILKGVWCFDAANCWVVGEGGIIQRLQINAPIAIPSLANANWEHDELGSTASQAQCLGDPTSFNVKVGSSLIGFTDLDSYAIRTTDNVVIVAKDDSQMWATNGRAFRFNLTLPSGPYTLLTVADEVVGSDVFDEVGFNVPQGSCYLQSQHQDLVDRLNALPIAITNEINNANATVAQGGLLGLGAFTGYSLGDTTVLVFFFFLMLWCMYQGYFLAAFGAFLGVLQVLVENFDTTTTMNEHGFLITFVLFLIFVWVEALVRGWRLRKANALQEAG
jgi:hypothetical protein